MPKKDTKTFADLLKRTKQLAHQSEDTNIPDIITFCEDKKYLGLSIDRENPGNSSTSIELYPVQKLALKAFYRGSIGNEHLTLTKEEIALCKSIGLDGAKNGDVLGKIANGAIFRELVLVWGRRCLSGDTEIIDPQTGRLWTMQEMWNYGKTTIHSWTLDQRTGDMVVIPNADLLYQGKREVFAVTLDSGHEIECTDNHPLLTQFGWKQVKDIVSGVDAVAVAESQPFFGNSDAISENEAAILGYMTGDGCCSKSATFFSGAKTEVVADLTRRLSLFSSNLEIKQYNGDKNHYSRKNLFRITKATDKYAKEVYYDTVACRKRTKSVKSDLDSLLEKHGLRFKTSHQKEVPKAIYECPKNVIAAYLKALWSCDGNITTRTDEQHPGHVSIEFSTVNEKQAKKVQHLLSRFGIIARLRAKISSTHVTDKVYGRYDYKDHKSFIVSFSRAKYVKIFLENLLPVGKSAFIEDAKRCLQGIYNRSGVKLERESFHYETVRSIESRGEKDTFDMSVSCDERTQNYVAQGVISHNSGKDFFCSLIALYEAMKLLEAPGGDPYTQYSLSSANPFCILTIANSAGQARILFNEIKDKLMRSPYFQQKYTSSGIKSDAIYLMTPKDQKDRQKCEEENRPYIKEGSVLIQAGHSNSNSLLGKGCFVLMLDEVASYRQTGGASSGDAIYNGLSPTIATYVRKVKTVNDEGKVEEKIVYDGKIVVISSPRGQDGLFWNLYDKAKNIPDRLMCRLPTWLVNPGHSEESLRAREKQMTPEVFNMEYGAEFSGLAGENFFPPTSVEACFANNYHMKEVGVPNVTYFAHLDPALSSHNYALAIVHKEVFLNKDTRKLDFYIVVDRLKLWSPGFTKDGETLPIQIDEVDDYMLWINKRFHLGLVTYDQWNSQSSINKLLKAGIPAQCTRFNRHYKMQIYDELYGLVVAGKLRIPYDKKVSQTTRNEMLNLQRRYSGGSGYKICPKSEGEVRTDDCCVSPQSIVVSSRGFIPIKDILVGDQVLSHAGEFRVVTGTSIHAPTVGILDIKPFYSPTVTITENHPVLSYDGAVFSWKTANKLRKGGWIIKKISQKTDSLDVFDMTSLVTESALKHSTQKDDIEWKSNHKVREINGHATWHNKFIKYDEDLGFFLGSFLAEGSLGDHSVSFATDTKEKLFRKMLQRKTRRIFGVDKFYTTTREDTHCSSLSFNSCLVKKFIKYHVSGTAISKSMTNEMLHSNKCFQIGLLRGMFEGDGCSSLKKKYFCFTTTSKILALQIEYLLLRFGVVSSLSVSKRKGQTTHFGERKCNYNADLYNLRVFDSESYNKLAKILHFGLRSKKQSVYHKPHYKWIDECTLACQIRSIAAGNAEYVCNLAVEADHSYLIDGCVATHNCDALAGACFNALRQTHTRLPTARLVHTGVSQSSGARQWMGMQGVPIGTNTQGMQMDQRTLLRLLGK